MSRSRAFNRSSRLTAKRRRRVLRSVVPGFEGDSRKVDKPIDHSQDLLQKANEKEALAELIEPQMII